MIADENQEAEETEELPKSFMDLLTEMLIKKYGKTIVEYGGNPRNYSPLDDANGYATYTGPCGDTMQMWVKITDDTIENIGFQTDGCDFTRAAGSMLTELAKGKSLPEALQISPIQVDIELGGLPEDHRHCALLARETFRRAVANWYENAAKNG